MKQLYRLIIFGLISALVLTGCDKAPTQEITDAKAQVEAATTADTQTYAADELAQLTSTLEAAEEEVKTQDEKWFGNFDKAKEMLAAIKPSAENVSVVAAQRKEEARNKAVTAQYEAVVAIADAKALLEQAPTGKETKADIEYFKADLAGLEETLTGLQQSIDEEKYSEAVDSANVIKEMASSISVEISQALEKVKSSNKESSKNPIK